MNQKALINILFVLVVVLIAGVVYFAFFNKPVVSPAVGTSPTPQITQKITPSPSPQSTPTPAMSPTPSLSPFFFGITSPKQGEKYGWMESMKIIIISESLSVKADLYLYKGNTLVQKIGEVQTSGGSFLSGEYIWKIPMIAGGSDYRIEARHNSSRHLPKSVFSGHFSISEGAMVEKPVIYLYPTKEQHVTVQLDYRGKIVASYPQYNNLIGGWNVVAYPDGHLINSIDKREYSYLFWEGKPIIPVNWDLSTGFVVKGIDVQEFLQQTLSKMGLTPREYNEFIVYWYPHMKDNPYNLIHFAGKDYAETAPLKITPNPDSMLRVFMVFKPLDKKIDIKPQDIQSFKRKGFAVIEWGGIEIK